MASVVMHTRCSSFAKRPPMRAVIYAAKYANVVPTSATRQAMTMELNQ